MVRVGDEVLARVRDALISEKDRDDERKQQEGGEGEERGGGGGRERERDIAVEILT